ncbi:MAG: S8 family serine peptidase [Gemmatimonadota bacterium]|nr:S8 family serine peptidase [Gemmatimonadota bacterium]
MASYLDSGSDRLIILATGDNDTLGAFGLTGSLNALKSSTNKLLNASDGVAAELLLDPSYRGKILLVTGTVQGGLSRRESHVWTGTDSTIIAAPAEGVYSLSPSGALNSYRGTSFAVPYVTGTAAQLWTMDPTLTAREVVGYIIEGAKSSRVDLVTGGPLTPSNVGYAGVYQLDAYGALRRLSQERSTAPLCGLEMQYNGSGRLVIARNAPTSFPIDGDGSKTSVAQGGRLIADGATYAGNTTKVKVYSQTGTLLSTLPGIWRKDYLERDTVDFFYDFTFGGPNSMSLRRQDGTGNFFKLDSVAEPGRYGANILEAKVSPDGAWVVARGEYSLTNGPICLPASTPAQATRPYARTHLIRLADGASQLLRSDELYAFPCVPLSYSPVDWSDVPVWRPDAARFLLLVAVSQYSGSTLTGWSGLLREYTAQSPTTIVGSGTHSGLWPFYGWLPADGSHLRTGNTDFNAGNWQTVFALYRPVAPFAFLSQSVQRWPSQLVPLRGANESASVVQPPVLRRPNQHAGSERAAITGPRVVPGN